MKERRNVKGDKQRENEEEGRIDSEEEKKEMIKQELRK